MILYSLLATGRSIRRADLVQDAKSGKTHYAHQEDSDQTVRVWGDTAVVTAKLWAQGIEDGKAVDYKLWFSDTYVRTPKGWSYVFGMASLPLPSGARPSRRRVSSTAPTRVLSSGPAPHRSSSILSNNSYPDLSA